MSLSRYSSNETAWTYYLNISIKKGMKEPYDWNAYAETFFPAAQRLVREASHAERLCQWEKASELFLYS